MANQKQGDILLSQSQNFIQHNTSANEQNFYPQQGGAMVQQYQYPNNVLYNTQISQNTNDLPQQYHNNTTPLQSPTFTHAEQIPYPQSEPTLTPTTPHPGMQNAFFPQQQNSAFNKLVEAAGEAQKDDQQLVQDIIDDATCSSEDHRNGMYMSNMPPDTAPYPVETLPYTQNPEITNIQTPLNQPINNNMIPYQQSVKQEPQSPMLKSPHHVHSFFGPRMQYHAPMQSPGTMGMHRTASSSSLQSVNTPTSEQHWQYPPPQT